jgi:hypothetical protein
MNKGACRINPPPDEDPWAGLFHPDNHSYGTDNCGDHDDQDDDNEVLDPSDSHDDIFYDDGDELYEGP